MPCNELLGRDLQDITDTMEFNKDGFLLPLGGREEACELAPPLWPAPSHTSCIIAGYKGYGLCAMVEVLCGVMSGGPYAEHIRKWTGDPSKADLVCTYRNLVRIFYFKFQSQMFMALDPSVFVDDFPTRLNGMMSDLRNMEPVKFLYSVSNTHSHNYCKTGNFGVVKLWQNLILTKETLTKC